MKNEFIPGPQTSHVFNSRSLSALINDLNDFTGVHEDVDGEPVYHHIDHVQIIPPHGDVPTYSLFIVYRTVSAKEEEARHP